MKRNSIFTLTGFLPILVIQTGLPLIDNNLYWLLPVVFVVLVFSSVSLFNNLKSKAWFSKQKIKVELGKSRLYYPEFIKLTIINTGNINADLDRPVIIFDNFWLKRKFRISGVDGRAIYPLYLETGKFHTLNIDLSPFYEYDRKLKRYPKVSIVVLNMKGKRLGSHTTYLRKTLIKF